MLPSQSPSPLRGIFAAMKETSPNGRRVAQPAEVDEDAEQKTPGPFTLEAEPNEAFDAVMVGDLVIATAEASTDMAGPMAGAILAGRVEFKTPHDVVLRMANGRLVTCDRETWKGWWKSLFRTAAAATVALVLVGCPSLGVNYDPEAGAVTGTVIYKWPAGKQPVE